MTRRTLGFAAVLYGVSILVSRVIGLVREAVIGRTLGNGGEADVYFTAFIIPDFLNYLLAGGALSLVFIPLFQAHLARGDAAAGWRAFSNIANLLLALLVLATVGLFLAAPALAPVIAPGLTPAQHELLTHLVRILLPAQIFHVVGGLLSATLQARERHMAPALAPLVYGGGVVAFGLALGPTLGAEGFAWGVLAGSFLGPFLLPLVACLRTDLRWSFTLSLGDADLRTWLRRSLPVMLGVSVVVFDDFLLRIFGSLAEPGTIARLTYAKTLMRVPMGVFGLAAGVAAYPVLSRLFAEGRASEASETLRRAVRATLLLAVLAQAGLTVAGPQLALCIWGQERFTPAELGEIGSLTGWICLGLWAWSIQGLLARNFYAQGDTWTPTLVGSAATLLAAPLYWILGREYGAVGLALASSVAISGNVVALSWQMGRMGRSGRARPSPTAPGLGDALLRLAGPLLVGVLAGRSLATSLEVALQGLPAVPRALLTGGLSGSVAVSLTLGGAYALRLPEVRFVVERVSARARRLGR